MLFSFRNIQNAHCCEIMFWGVALSFQFVAVLCCFSECFKLEAGCLSHLTFLGRSDNMLKACHTSVPMLVHFFSAQTTSVLNCSYFRCCQQWRDHKDRLFSLCKVCTDRWVMAILWKGCVKWAFHLFFHPQTHTLPTSHVFFSHLLTTVHSVAQHLIIKSSLTTPSHCFDTP